MRRSSDEQEALLSASSACLWTRGHESWCRSLLSRCPLVWDCRYIVSQDKMVPDPGRLSNHRGKRRVGGLVIQGETSCRDQGFMGLSFDKDLTCFASSGPLGVCQCIGQ